jgi:outer membrane receptor protein involved in Fe transport
VGQLDFGDFVASADIDIGQVEAGNPDLEPHKAWEIEAVYERRFWDKGVFDVTYQHAEVEDVIDIIPLVGGFEGVGNIGDGTSDFFQLRLTLPTDRLGVPGGRLIARGSWSWTEVTDPLTGEPRRFQGNQYFGCGVDFNQDLAGGRWSWGLQHGCNVDRGTSFRIREVREGYSEPFVTLWGQWKPDDRTTVRLDLGNATDRQNGYDRDIYTGPRDVSPVAYREVRRTKMSPWLFVQVRRTF